MASSEQQSSSSEEETSLTVTLEDGSLVEHDYVMRGLREDEIGSWADFCASVFSYKENPPPACYFERHYRNDPNAQADLVRVVFYKNKIVSSCRIFRKEISLGSSSSDDDGKSILKTVLAGGIGEVCTCFEHRRRGLSKYLLQNAIQIMKDHRSGMQLSFLHSAPNFFPVYQRGGGYASTVSQWSSATIQLDKLKVLLDNRQSNNSTTSSIRFAEFPKDTRRLQSLHHDYSEKRFAGCIVRSQNYWNDYLSKELNGTLYVMENEAGIIVAWMSLRRRGNRLFQLREFGCDTSICPEDKAVSQLLAACLEGQQLQQQHDNDELTTVIIVTLQLPSFILSSINVNEFVQTVTEENDLGWMYVTVQDGSAIDMVEINKSTPHLIWPADSF
jgi:predicted GNAT family N-acyltransferase